MSSDSEPESKPEVKTETKVKSEAKPEVKPEAKSEVKPEVKPESNPAQPPTKPPPPAPTSKPPPPVKDEPIEPPNEETESEDEDYVPSPPMSPAYEPEPQRVPATPQVRGSPKGSRQTTPKVRLGNKLVFRISCHQNSRKLLYRPYDMNKCLRIFNHFEGFLNTESQIDFLKGGNCQLIISLKLKGHYILIRNPYHIVAQISYCLFTD